MPGDPRRFHMERWSRAMAKAADKWATKAKVWTGRIHKVDDFLEMLDGEDACCHAALLTLKRTRHQTGLRLHGLKSCSAKKKKRAKEHTVKNLSFTFKGLKIAWVGKNPEEADDHEVSWLARQQTSSALEFQVYVLGIKGPRRPRRRWPKRAV